MLVSRRTTAGLTFAGLLCAVLSTAGCGCTDDSFLTVPPGDIAATQVARTQVGIELERSPGAAGALKVDVMFLLDDGFSMTDRTAEAGNRPPGQILGDTRFKVDVANEIFTHVTDTLAQRLVDDGVALTSGEFDLAFGLSRYEDYANFARGDERPPIDPQSRPFVLNQPIFRQAEARFRADFLFAQGLEAPGSGGVTPFDAQSALEALYQLATGEGFDGNRDGDTVDSGGVCDLETMLEPGPSGDVPQFEATLVSGGDPAAPVYEVGSRNASGTLGGAGWRPDSIRFIVLVSDTCTVTSLGLADPNLDRDLTTNTIVGPVSNAPSPAGTGPRGSETIQNVQAFACRAIENKDEAYDTQAVERYGWSDDARVAPDNGATLQETIAALNEMDIEVLSIGIGDFVAPTPNKPNLPGFPQESGEYPAIENPTAPASPAGTPYSFMSAVAILTGARDTNQDGEEPKDDRWVEGLPLVYKIDVVSPADGPIKSDVEADLSDRIAEWKAYGSGGSTGSVYYKVTFDFQSSNPDLTLEQVIPLVPRPDPGGSDPIYVSQSGNEQIVRVPCYDPATTENPEPIRVAWTANLRRSDSESTNEILSVMPANVTAVVESSTCGGTPPAVVPSSGSVTMIFPAIVDALDPPIATSTLSAVSSGALLFRDLERGIPAGTGIGTMAGPLDTNDVPYPTP